MTSSIINQIAPEKMIVSFSYPFGNCGKYVQEYSINFNKVNFTTTIQLIMNSTFINISSLINFEQFYIRESTYKYEEEEETKYIMVGGIKISIPFECQMKNAIIVDSNEIIQNEKNYFETIIYDFN